MKKLNNKGMTLVELVVTFAIVMILVLGMLNVIITLKTDMNDSTLDKELLEYRNTVTYVVNNDLITLKAKEVESCTFNSETTDDKGYCYTINFEDNTSKKLEISLLNKYIKYDGIKYEIPESSIMEFRDSLIYASDNANDKVSINKDENDFINIQIPFYIIDEDENYGINIVHPINLEYDSQFDVEFFYTGNYQEYKAPTAGYYYIESSGAQGSSSSTGDGGLGGYTSGYIYLNKGEKLYIYVGARGNTFNGGGETTYNEHGGGGASDIRYFNDIVPTSTDLEWDSTLGLNSRIMVAAGGGGNSSLMSGSKGGYAGGLIGGDGSSHSSVGSTYNGYGAKQTIGGVENSNGGSAGVFGIGGSSGVYTDGHVGGSGGGGYYGGSGAKWHAGAGGGSSFISGYAGSNAINSSSDRTHTNNTLHYSSKYFIDGNMVSGYNSGNGRAIISYVGKTLKRTNDKLNNVRYIKDCINGNVNNTYNHWTEIQAIVNGNNVAFEKDVTTTATLASGNYPETVTDGIIEDQISNYINGSSGNQCVTIDLKATYNLDEIAVWHYYADGRSYNNHSLKVSSDNSSWTTLIDNESGVVETSEGKRVSAYGDSYVLTNLVKNGSFEDGTTSWTISGTKDASSIDSSITKYGSKSLKTNYSAQTSVLVDQTVSIPVGHIFYYQMHINITNHTNGSMLLEAKYTDESGYQGFNMGGYSSTTSGYIMQSKIGTSTSSSVNIRLGMYQGIMTGYQDGILLVDLTEAFGAGNEPSKEWCDEHLRYFDGTIKIAASSLD